MLFVQRICLKFRKSGFFAEVLRDLQDGMEQVFFHPVQYWRPVHCIGRHFISCIVCYL